MSDWKFANLHFFKQRHAKLFHPNHDAMCPDCRLVAAQTEAEALESQLAAAQRAKEQTVHHWQNVAERFKAQLYELFVAFGVSQVHEVFIKKQEMEQQLAAHVQTIGEAAGWESALKTRIDTLTGMWKDSQQQLRAREAEIARLRDSHISCNPAGYDLAAKEAISQLTQQLREREEQLATAEQNYAGVTEAKTLLFNSWQEMRCELAKMREALDAILRALNGENYLSMRNATRDWLRNQVKAALAKHHPSCSYPECACSCGLDAALAKPTAEKEEN